MKPFLSQRSQRIIQRMTNTPFYLRGNLWLYWLFRLELIPGGWFAKFYLEVNTKEEAKWFEKKGLRYIFSGDGTPDEAVQRAYKTINKKWLSKGSALGKKENKKFKKEWALRSKGK